LEGVTATLGEAWTLAVLAWMLAVPAGMLSVPAGMPVVTGTLGEAGVTLSVATGWAGWTESVALWVVVVWAKA